VDNSALRGLTAMHAAAQGNHPLCIDLLCQLGLSVHATTTDTCWAPLHTAADYGSVEAASRLLAALDDEQHHQRLTASCTGQLHRPAAAYSPDTPTEPCKQVACASAPPA